MSPLRTFTASLTEAQRQQQLFVLDGSQRTTSRDPTLTPAFCAVLAWCVPGWGLSLGTLSFEQRMAFEAFLRAARRAHALHLGLRIDDQCGARTAAPIWLSLARGGGCKHEENGEEAVGALLEGSGILEEA